MFRFLIKVSLYEDGGILLKAFEVQLPKKRKESEPQFEDSQLNRSLYILQNNNLE